MKSLLIADAAAGQPTAVATTPAPAAPLTLQTAAQHVADLEAAVAEAATVAGALLNDPHLAKCPFVAAIKSGIENGAANRLVHLKNWLAANPVPAPSAPAAKL